MSNATSGRRNERRFAAKYGGEVISAPWQEGADVLQEGWLYVDCKQRSALPKWLLAALAKVRLDAYKAGGENALGVLALHLRGRHDDIIVISAKDFYAHFGGDGNERPNGES